MVWVSLEDNNGHQGLHANSRCTWSLCLDSPANDGYLGRGTVNNRVSLLRRFVEVHPLSYEFFFFSFFFYSKTLYIWILFIINQIQLEFYFY